MVISFGSSNNSWFFYRSNVDDLSRADLSWEQVRTPLGPDTEDAHQTLNFLREGSINGDLYIAGARGRLLADRDKIDLYRVDAVFTDPGLRDHQTAQISWGDGTTNQNTAFSSFNEAFGDGTGSLSHTHVFNTPGTYAVQLTITDSDNDSDVESANVRVLTPEQAVVELIAMIDAVISSTTDSHVLADLQQARRALTGTNENSQNGALPMIHSG